MGVTRPASSTTSPVLLTVSRAVLYCHFALSTSALHLSLWLFLFSRFTAFLTGFLIAFLAEGGGGVFALRCFVIMLSNRPIGVRIISFICLLWEHVYLKISCLGGNKIGVARIQQLKDLRFLMGNLGSVQKLIERSP